jgi:hypothetical protein
MLRENYTAWLVRHNSNRRSVRTGCADGLCFAPTRWINRAGLAIWIVRAIHCSLSAVRFSLDAEQSCHSRY